MFLGSTRKFTRWPDDHARGVLAGEAAFLASGRRGVMLHPTMIYGAQGEDNVQRLAKLLRWLPVVPLPGGGRALVQPIWQGDVTACIRAALGVDWARAETVVIAGPEAVTYADFVRAVARAAGLGAPRFVGISGAVLRVMAGAVGWVPGIPRIGGMRCGGWGRIRRSILGQWWGCWGGGRLGWEMGWRGSLGGLDGVSMTHG